MELQSEESRLAGKLARRARTLVAESGDRLTFQAAMVQACRDYPVAYRKYTEVRNALGALGFRPLPIDGLKLGKG